MTALAIRMSDPKLFRSEADFFSFVAQHEHSLGKDYERLFNLLSANNIEHFSKILREVMAHNSQFHPIMSALLYRACLGNRKKIAEVLIAHGAKPETYSHNVLSMMRTRAWIKQKDIEDLGQILEAQNQAREVHG